MSLSSSLYAGISGLNTLGNSMQIIGDNIANVNTVGFKNSAYAFQDLLSQSIATLSGTSQIGRGVAMGSVYADFQQATFELTGNTTDFGISGDGFFQLREPSSTGMYYSRAGNFHFDSDGYLVNPDGYVVQGWALDATGATVGSETDIQISGATSPPSETDSMTVIVNLDAEASSNTATMETVWDGTASTPLDSQYYEYNTTLQVYDSLGSQHDITIYFDPDGTTANVWDYIITCDPSEDQRAFITAAAPTQYAGLLARGTLTFDPSTGLMTAAGPTMDTLTAVAPTWTAGATNTDGLFEFNPTFIAGTPMTVAFDPGTNDSYAAGTFVNDSLTTTQYSRNSDTAYYTQNGYAAGDLQSIDVDTDGTMTGIYTNGQTTPLFRVTLSSFMNNQGLLKEGGNLYRATTESGTFTNHVPGTGVGTIVPNSLEQSNVDIATEFVRMITTQRGYQANSKIVTTVDAMMAEAVQMKR